MMPLVPTAFEGQLGVCQTKWRSSISEGGEQGQISQGTAQAHSGKEGSKGVWGSRGFGQPACWKGPQERPPIHPPLLHLEQFPETGMKQQNLLTGA